MAGEPFKALHEVVMADDRWRGFAVRDGHSVRPRELADHYASVALVVISPNVPSHVADVFTTAKHLALYSWFVYRFAPVARLQAYAALEYGLRERLGIHEDDSRGLRWLLRRAAAEDILGVSMFGNVLPYSRVGSRPDAFEVCVRYFVWCRNDLAHGTATLAPFAFAELEIVSRALNRLFPHDAPGGV